MHTLNIRPIFVSTSNNKTTISPSKGTHQKAMSVKSMKKPSFPYRYWTDEEVNYLRQHYGKKLVVDISKHLGRTRKAVEKKAVKIGLRSKVKGSLLRQKAHLNFGPRPTGKDHPLWREPLIPWEQKGRLVIKRRGDSLPESYARYRIEVEQGRTLAPDEIVVHRDGNPLNCDLDNLEVITRAENARRNSIYRYPPDVVKAIRQFSKLKKAISNAQEQTLRP